MHLDYNTKRARVHLIFSLISIIQYTTKKSSSDGQLSSCPYLESTKDALCYKLRRLTIDQNCSAICINKGDHKDEQTVQSAMHFKRPANELVENWTFKYAAECHHYTVSQAAALGLQ